MAGSCSSQLALYKSVVEDVVTNVREYFLDEGVDEQVLLELKQLWLNKLHASKAVEGVKSDQEQTLNMYGSNPALLHQHRQQQQQLLRQQQALQQQQQQHQQHQQQQQISQSQLPTAVLNSQLSGGSTGEASGVVSSGNETAPTTVQGATLYPQQLAALGGGQIITLQTPQGPTQFLLQGNVGATGTSVLTPQQLAAVQAQAQQQQQQQQTVQLTPQQQAQQNIVQLDGHAETSSDDENDDDDDDDNDDDEKDDEEGDEAREEDDPLNSDDDVSEEDPSELFDTDNVVVCQFDKINRTKNKWRFHLKDGIMNLKGKDYVFQKATGESEW